MEAQKVIICHGPCQDGYAAAWSYWRTLPISFREDISKLENISRLCKREKKTYKILDMESEETPVTKGLSLLSEGSPIAFIFCMPREELSVELVKDRDVFILDLDMTSQVEVLKNAKSVLIIDHHSSGEKGYSKLMENKENGFRVVYNTKKSAAKLSWEFFNGDLPCRMVDYVQDRDIWTWSLPHSSEINEAMYTLSSFENFWDMEQFYLDWQNDPVKFEEKLYGIGEGAKVYQNKLVDDFSRRIVPATFKCGTEDNYIEIPVLLCNSSTLRSEIGNCIMEQYSKYYEEIGFVAKMACIWGYNIIKDIITVSCRTNRDDTDLNDYIATVIGSEGKGGGHKKAGAFALSGCDIKKVFTVVTNLKSKDEEKKQIKE